MRVVGRLDEALVEARKALELDPLSPIMMMNVGDRLNVLERHDEAMEYFNRALAIDPNFIPAMSGLVWAYLCKSMFDKAVEAQQTLSGLFQGEARSKSSLAIVYGLSGRIEEGRKLLDEALSPTGKGYIPPNEIAMGYFALGDDDKVFEWCERAVREKDGGLLYLKCDPLTMRLRQDPRFIEILRKMGL